jgi:hypothetical protein
MRPGRGVRAGVALAAAGLAAGCGLFKPAAHVGVAPGTRPYIANYAVPESTLTWVALALESKGYSNSASVYAGALADSITGTDPNSFHALFDPQVYQLYLQKQQPAIDDWDRSRELNFYDRFATLRSDPYVVRFDRFDAFPDPATPTSSSAYRRHYVVNTISTAGDTTTIAIGVADLWFAASGGQWKLVKWDDHIDQQVGPNPTDERKSMTARRLGL